MQLGIVIHSTDAETVWNAFRLAVFSLGKGEKVKVFLLAKGVEAEKLETDKFKVREQMQAFADAGGDILACGTCLTLRHEEGSELCPLSTMEDLYEIVRDSDRLLTF